MATNVDDLLIDDDYNMDLRPLQEIEDKDKLGEVIMDFSFPQDYRTSALEHFAEKYNTDIAEIVNKITGMYIFSRTKMLEEFIQHICIHSKLHNDLKVILVKALCSHKQDIAYTTLNVVCKDLSNVPTPVQVDTVKILFNSVEYRSNGLLYFVNIINNQDIDCDFRYKTILGLEHDNEDTESLISSPEDSEDERENTRISYMNDLIMGKNKYIIHVIKQSMLSFFYNSDNKMMYRLLAGQYLLQNCCNDKEEIENIENVVIDIAEDPSVEYNTRADAADVILQLGVDKQRAQRVIMILGNVEGKARTIFENAQNAHYDEFAKSVNEGIDFLNTIPLLKIEGVSITFEYIKKQVENLIKQRYGDPVKNNTDKVVVEKIHIAINRINMDRALYSKYNCTLIGILLKVWTYLASHESKDAMQQRLLEELHDMAGICSTGFAERLINVISGFGDFNFRISFEDQIVANFSGRLNARARNIVEEWNSQKRLMTIGVTMINMDEELKKDVFRRYLKDNGLLGKYEYIIKGPYRKRVNAFEDPQEYDKMLTKMSTDGDAPNNEAMYNTYIKILTDDLEVEPTMHILQEFQGNVLTEISVDTSVASERTCFAAFLREEMLSIRDELWKEFKDHISDQEFDNYFRTAVSKYESA